MIGLFGNGLRLSWALPYGIFSRMEEVFWKTKTEEAFWKTKTLDRMSREEWESLCDGCGRCCLRKLEDTDTGRIHFTAVACRLLDLHSCRCVDYTHRSRRVPECLPLSPAESASRRWLPSTCAYRLLAEGGELPPWHPLITGDPESIHDAGISVRDRAISERYVKVADLEAYMIAEGL